MNDNDRMKLLAIYLDDHWAGAGAGHQLARRLLRNNRRTGWVDQLSWLSDQIESDERTLLQLRRRLNLDGGKVKRALGIAGVRLSGLKPNGRLLAYSPLSRVLEAELMMSGVDAKKRLWAALRSGQLMSADFSGLDFAELERRAEEQLTMLSSFHEEASALAFGPGQPDAGT